MEATAIIQGALTIVTMGASGFAAWHAKSTGLTVSRLHMKIMQEQADRLEKCRQEFISRRECDMLQRVAKAESKARGAPNPSKGMD